MTSVVVRNELVRALELDLIGPFDSYQAEEVLDQRPSAWYLTGFLVPDGQDYFDETGNEADSSGDESPGSDTETYDGASAKKAKFPSSMGLCVLIDPRTKHLDVTIRWGDYQAIKFEEPTAPDPKTPLLPGAALPKEWQRRPRLEKVHVPVPADGKAGDHPVPHSEGLHLVITSQTVPDLPVLAGHLPAGTRSVSVFLVNSRRPVVPDYLADQAYAFQAELTVRTQESIIARPNLHGIKTDDQDEQLADLQYCQEYEYAVGLNVAAEPIFEADRTCHAARTTWLPTAEVERVAPQSFPQVEMGMEALATLPTAAAVREKLAPLVAEYREWIDKQLVPGGCVTGQRQGQADTLKQRAHHAAKRIAAGLELLDDPEVFTAFRLMNQVMAMAYRQRKGVEDHCAPSEVKAPEWRPFQLAFIVMNLRGIADPQGQHGDRHAVDLLFFPTGGGKTEAYLGLAAFTLVLRRRRQQGRLSGGVSVLMRYTLRLLTLDQLSRASTLICALELERQRDTTLLGDWPFEIGLWVGRAATPNVMGQKGDGKEETARQRTIDYMTERSKAPPIPIEECPWCGKKFERGKNKSENPFELWPNEAKPIDLIVRCFNRNCAFYRDIPLPIVAVDEPIYRRLPCFIIATVDKFAAMPWTGQVGALFGRVDRYDNDGYYGPCGEANRGQPLGGSLPPPDLIIQDELHLISGPMGTMVGLYEAALDALCSRTVNGELVRPKIIASTATVRRATQQIKSLFTRDFVDVFPPPGPNRHNSFFARTVPAEESPARLYLGIAAQGRSPKKMLLRIYLALLSVAQREYVAAGGDKNEHNPADPYMTLLGYFNSLKELGSSRRVIEDEITTRLQHYSQRKRLSEATGLFADRKIGFEPQELTSRVPTHEVATARQKLRQPHFQKDHVDVAIATNMISVGLDIPRLGLMVVTGQPKTHAEYIQATSRVGRDPKKPGLIITMMNIHKPRDRSHYERFRYYHQTFYRSVEATSVTPFSSRALDRGLAGTVVALARLGHEPLMAPRSAEKLSQHRQKLEYVLREMAERARNSTHGRMTDPAALAHKVRGLVDDLFDAWDHIASGYHELGVQLQYGHEMPSPQPLLRGFLDPDLKKLEPHHRRFRANRSMRDVEAGVDLWVKLLVGQDGVSLEEDA